MTADSTIRLSKPVVKWLNSIRGYAQYATGKTYTMDDILSYMCGITDFVLQSRNDVFDDNYTKYVVYRSNQFQELARTEEMMEELEEIKKKMPQAPIADIILTHPDGNRACPKCYTWTKKKKCPKCGHQFN